MTCSIMWNQRIYSRSPRLTCNYRGLECWIYWGPFWRKCNTLLKFEQQGRIYLNPCADRLNCHLFFISTVNGKKEEKLDSIARQAARHYYTARRNSNHLGSSQLGSARLDYTALHGLKLVDHQLHIFYSSFKRKLPFSFLKLKIIYIARCRKEIRRIPTDLT